MENIQKIEEKLTMLMESDERTMSKRFHEGEDGQYKDGYYDGVYAALKIVKEFVDKELKNK